MRVIGKTYGKQRTQRSTSAPHDMKKRVDKVATRYSVLRRRGCRGKGKRTTQKHHAQPPQLKQPRAPDIFDRGPSCKEENTVRGVRNTQMQNLSYASRTTLAQNKSTRNSHCTHFFSFDDDGGGLSEKAQRMRRRLKKRMCFRKQAKHVTNTCTLS